MRPNGKQLKMRRTPQQGVKVSTKKGLTTSLAGTSLRKKPARRGRASRGIMLEWGAAPRPVTLTRLSQLGFLA
jgi:hypothetical protein